MTDEMTADMIPDEGGKVELGSGSYTLDSNFKVPNDRPVIIEGEGPATKITVDGSDPAFRLTGGNVEIRDLKIHDVTTGIRLSGDRDYEKFEVSNVTFEKCKSHAVHVPLGLDVTIDRVRLFNNFVKDSARGLYIRAKRTNDVKIDNNRLQNLSVRGIIVGMASGGDDKWWDATKITGNVIKDVVGTAHTIGIQVFGTGATVRDNTIENVGRSDDGGRSEGIDVRVGESRIVDNHLVDAGGSAGAISCAIGSYQRDGNITRGVGVTIENNHILFEDSHLDNPRAINTRVEEVSVLGNTIKGAYSGVNIRRGHHITISNNEITRAWSGDSENYVYGVRVVPSWNIEDATSNTLIIEGNRMEHFHPVDTHTIGVEFDPAGDPINCTTISDNVFRDFQSSSGCSERGLDFYDADGNVNEVILDGNTFDEIGTAVKSPEKVNEIVVGENVGYDG